MATQPRPVAFNVSIPCEHCKVDLLLTIRGHLGPLYAHPGYALVTCPDCKGQMQAKTPGDILAGPSVISHYGKQTHVACKKCGRNIFVTSATAFLREGERHVELSCNSPACAHADIYNEFELEIHGD
jgi:ribosomal protein S27E